MSRQGLKRLECSSGCGALVYATLTQLERHGLPQCACGAALVPESLEVAAAVMSREALERTPAWRELEREASSVMHGQSSHIQRGRQVRAPESIATERVESSARAAARTRRLSGLRQYKAAADAAAAMPF